MYECTCVASRSNRFERQSKGPSRRILVSYDRVCIEHADIFDRGWNRFVIGKCST